MVSTTAFTPLALLLACFGPALSFNIPYQQSQAAPQSDSFVISNILNSPPTNQNGVDIHQHQEYSPWHSNDMNTPAPLYITIGPPASGKTTWLAQKMVEQNPQSQGQAVDISMDDMSNVYVKVPFNLYCMTQAEMESPEVYYEDRYILSRSYYGRTVQERILSEDQYELRLVCQRLCQKISKEEFQNLLRSFHSASFNHEKKSNANIEYVVKTLVERVENLLANKAALPVLPSTVDLFVIEAVFDTDPSMPHGQLTGVERTNNLLHQTPTNVPVAWGNTNTFPGDYVTALQVAAQQGRPVHFCVYGDNNSMHGPEKYFDLPKLKFHQLIDRNLQRFLQSGKYIPCMILDGHVTAADKMVAEAARTMTAPTKLDLDRQLAKLADFEMRDDRTVVPRGQNEESWRQDREQPQAPYDDPLYWPGRMEKPQFHDFNPFDNFHRYHLPPPPPPYFQEKHEDFPWFDYHFPNPEMENNVLPPEFGYGGPPPPGRSDINISPANNKNRFSRKQGDNSDNPLNYQGAKKKKSQNSSQSSKFEDSMWGEARSRESYEKRGQEDDSNHGFGP